MPPSKTSTVKNKHAGPKRSSTDGVSKPKPKGGKPKPKVPGNEVTKPSTVKGRPDKVKKKRKTYTEAELGLPKLNSIVPAGGVVRPKGLKKGKVFVDDTESMTTIMAIVQAEKDGQIESKMIKARQMEEIRDARKVQQLKRETEQKEKLEGIKAGIRKKRKGDKIPGGRDAELNVDELPSAGMKAGKMNKKKVVSFAS